MPALGIATWNVLHRIHAINWREGISQAEHERAEAIAARIAAAPAAVWCLQEVSGDQLALLRIASSGGTIFSLGYPRVPALHRPDEEPSPLSDPTEHLVTLVPAGMPARVAHAEGFTSDPGKGVLVVELAGGVRVLNTHVSFGAKRTAQCATLAGLARATPATAIVLGDFNAERDVILAALGPDFTAVVPTAPALPTRPRSEAAGRPSTIDHIVVRAGVGMVATVEDCHGLSDHNPVLASVAVEPAA